MPPVYVPEFLLKRNVLPGVKTPSALHLAAALLFLPISALAGEGPAEVSLEPPAVPHPTPPSPVVPAPQPSAFTLSLDGYGETAFVFHDYGPDQTGEGGSPPDARLVFDQTRFVAALEGKLTGGVEFEAEIEFEHGGTGAALELEYEEYGEYEQEVEKGGEVLLEELYLEKELNERLSLKLGRFYVGVGQLFEAHRPTQYLGLLRPEAEVTVLPAVWDELGLAVNYRLEKARILVQVVNGLDSTGFSSQAWVSSGHQGRFEEIRARDLAGVLRLDLHPTKGILVGSSVYYGNTTGNRPKPDMAGIFAPLLILDLHLSLDLGPVRARGATVWGHLAEAETISDYNRRLSNALDVLRSSVADQALAAWVDLGVGVLGRPGSPHHLEIVSRLERYDTMFRVGENTFDNPRFGRTLVSAGLGYTYRSAVITRLIWNRRGFDSAELRPETTIGLMTGFVY